jgi:pimeloyl-ACP methyl ester carboxylesterase
MTKGTVLFVHGTGVQLRDYWPVFEAARKLAASVGIEGNFVECVWGDPLRGVFSGLSLPDPPSERQIGAEEQDLLKWEWLFEGPLLELETLTILDTKYPPTPAPPGQQAEWEILWARILAYKPSHDLELLLDGGGLKRFWSDAWNEVTRSETIPAAFEASAHELPNACAALARALVAQLHVIAFNNDALGPGRTLRDKLVLRLLTDWRQVVYAPSDLFVNFVKRATTRVLRRRRNDLTDAAALPIGDILLYQSRGAMVREYIRTKIEKAEPPVTVVAHSLGGIACFDLLALPDPPKVARLVTVASQVSLLYEIGALFSLKPPDSSPASNRRNLPVGFPPWLNIFDRNDFLSYVGNRLFAGVRDLEVESGQPFPESHSAYFANDQVWSAIRDFT